MFIEKQMDRKIFDILYLRSQNQIHTTNSELNKIICAAQIGHIIVFKSYVGEPIGYLIYAKVNGRVLQMIKNNYGEIAYPYEWKSGRIVYIVDFFVSKQQSTFAKKQFFSYLKSIKVAAFFKRGRISVVLRGRVIKKYPSANITPSQ